MTEMKVNEKSLETFFDRVVGDTMEYMEDMKSVAEDLSPIGVNSGIAGGWEISYEVDEERMIVHARLSNMMHYAIWQEVGTDPFAAKVEPFFLSRQDQKILKDIGGKVHRSKDGYIIAPIWAMRWGPLVKKSPPRDRWVKDQWRSPAVNYKRSWDLWFKILRKGISAKHFTHRTAEIMKQKKHLYPLAKSSGVRIEVGP